MKPRLRPDAYWRAGERLQIHIGTCASTQIFLTPLRGPVSSAARCDPSRFWILRFSATAPIAGRAKPVRGNLYVGVLGGLRVFSWLRPIPFGLSGPAGWCWKIGSQPGYHRLLHSTYRYPVIVGAEHCWEITFLCTVCRARDSQRETRVQWVFGIPLTDLSSVFCSSALLFARNSAKIVRRYCTNQEKIIVP